MPKNAKKTVYKEKEFQIYVLWKSMPAYFRGMKKEQLFSYGFTDPVILKIAMIKNQTAFAKHFHIKDLGTLTDWNNRIKNSRLTTGTFNSAIKKQLADINKKTDLQPDKLLKEKIREQNKIIQILKKENDAHKKQPETIAFKELEDRTSPPPLENRTISQKILNVFSKWRGK